MSLGGLARCIGFYGLDLLRGGRCIRHLRDIQAKSADPVRSDDEELRDILQYAIRNVPYYSTVKAPILSEFPVVDKKTFKREGMNCISREFTDLARLHEVHTGGSTGEPLVAYQDASKRDRVKMDLIHAHKNIGWDLGERYIFIRNWKARNKRSRAKLFAQNVRLVDVTTFNDEQKRELATFLRRHKSVLFGHASAIIDFMHFAVREKIDAEALRIPLIVCDSDELSEQNRAALQNTFRCPVYNRYDNEENGLIAISDGKSNQMTVNFPSLHIELLRLDSDDPAAPGEMGRVVITDLYNKAMPMIRYDTGDLAVSHDEPGKIRTLHELSGRMADTCLSANGTLISAAALSSVAKAFLSIERYCLFWKGDKAYTFCYEGELSEGDAAELQNRLHRLLGDDAAIEIKADAIKTGANGKRRTIVDAREDK